MTSAWRWLALIALALGAPALVSAQDPAAVKLLESKGLVAQGTFFVLPEEAELTKLLADKETVAAQKALRDLQRQVDGLARILEKQDEMMSAGTAQRVQLSAQLARARTVSENNKLVGQLDALQGQMELMSKEMEKGNSQLSQLRSQLSVKQEQVLQLLLKLQTKKTALEAKYAELAGDPSLAEALKAASFGGREARLGPSAAAKRSIDSIEKMGKMVDTEAVALREEAGTYLAQATIEGDTARTVEMCVDSGASVVCMPYALAAEIGLKPTDADPTVMMKLADGRVIPGKRKTIAKMRLGKFEVENVEAVVFGANLSEVEPLIGGSFLNKFNYKIDTEGRKLKLTPLDSTIKVEGEGN